MVKIVQLLNNPIASCCYIIYDNNKKCVIIDPGSESNDLLYSKLEELELTPEYIILTHEHFDHCWGVNDLRNNFPNLKLICSEECNNAIQKSKGNCSVFYDNSKAFEISSADVSVRNDVYLMNCNNINIIILKTAGHSSGSISIVIGNAIFTGDALMPGFKTVVKLPTSNLVEQISSESFFKTLEGYTIYPGHELPVKFDQKLFIWH